MKRFLEEDELNLVDPLTGLPITVPVDPAIVASPSGVPVVDPAVPAIDPVSAAVAPVPDVAPIVDPLVPVAEDTFDPSAVVAPAPQSGAAGDPPVQPINEDDVIQPELYDDPLDTSVVAPELGDFPADATIPGETVVTLDPDEEDIYEPDDLNESKDFIAKKAFRLPENRTIVVCRGEQLKFVGKAKTGLPKFAESTFAKALGKLTESRKGTLVEEGASDEKVALIGNSCLFEVAHDWQLPGTNLILEKGDIYQILGKGKIREEVDPDKKDDPDGSGDGKDDKDGKDDPDAPEGDDKGDKKNEGAKPKTGVLRESRGVHFGVADQY